jgi:hypothetical protein
MDEKNHQLSAETGEGGEKAPEETGTPGFTFNAFRDFLKFVEYVGDSAPVELSEPILDASGAVLVQRGHHIRNSLVTNLWKFFNQGNLNQNISISSTKALRAALRDKISRTLFICMDPGRFHVAHQLVGASRVNLLALAANIIERSDMLPIFLRLAQHEDPILPHLGEVALTAAGFAEQSLVISNDKNARELIRQSLLAGLLHDIGLADDPDFLVKDIEQAVSSDHAEKSARFVRETLPALNPVIAEIIAKHHRDANRYDPEAISAGLSNISEEALALGEYIFVQLRSQYKKDENMTPAELLFYSLGRAFGQGRFHPRFKSVAAKLWEQFYITLRYGFEIGKIESSCPHKPSAVAYPTPRCTQIMCHQNVTKCEHYDHQFPLEVMQATRFPGRPGITIQPGKYGKCKLAAQLPRGDDLKNVAAGWIEKGANPDAPKPAAP